MNNRILTTFKRCIPFSIKHAVKTSPLCVTYRSSAANVYHCSVYRTGSQWIRKILSDRRINRYSGFLYEMYFQRIFSTATQPDLTVPPEFPYSKPFRRRMIIGLYASYDGYLKVLKPQQYKTFFVTRDPRDIVVSHYFISRRDTAQLNNLEYYQKIAAPESGIPWMIDQLHEMGLFAAQRSWMLASNDPNVLLLRFEDLIGEQQFDWFKRLLAHCDIALPESVLKKLLEDYSFPTLAGGRRPGEPDINSHYRKGMAADWQNHFTPAHIDKFKTTTGDLATCLGYQW
jgi:hypothetical protein